MKNGLAVFAASVAALAFAPTFAQDSPRGSSRLHEAYAKKFSVSTEEAARRMERQREAGRLRATLARQEAAIFGGMYIEHSPQWRAVVRFTQSPQQTLARYTQDPMFSAEQAEVSYEALLRTQSALRAQLVALGIDSGSQVLEKTGTVEFFVLDPDRVRSLAATGALRLPANVQLTRVPDLDRDGEARIEGGRALNSSTQSRICTSGYTVYRTGQTDNLTRYILTSGHCPDTLSYGGLSLPFVGQRYSAPSMDDYQWNSVANFERPTNVIYEGLTELRPIEWVWPWGNMNTGDFICKYGNETGFTCGYIVSTNYDALGAGGFIRVSDDGYNVSSGGDSGGPWFYDAYNEAWGIHTDDAFEDPNDAIFMPVDRITSAGIDILRSP